MFSAGPLEVRSGTVKKGVIGVIKSTGSGDIGGKIWNKRTVGGGYEGVGARRPGSRHQQYME
jgi:hypothetical protein